MLCLDASLVVKLITGEVSPSLEALAMQWRSAGQSFIAPSLIGYEVSNALHRMHMTGTEALVIEKALESFDLLSIALVDDLAMHRQALDFAKHFRQPASYDSHYLAVASQYEVEFWTSDRKLYRAVERELSWVKFAE